MPVRGTCVRVTDKLLEIHERRDRMEMLTYQQKMAGQELSIKILQEEDRVIKEADRAALLSAEIVAWQKET